MSLPHQVGTLRSWDYVIVPNVLTEMILASKSAEGRAICEVWKMARK